MHGAWYSAVLGVAPYSCARAAREVGALGGMHARQRAVGNAVAVDILVAAPELSLIALSSQRVGVSTLPRSGVCVSSQENGSHTQSFMPMSRSDMTITGVCSRSARSKASAPT